MGYNYSKNGKSSLQNPWAHCGLRLVQYPSFIRVHSVGRVYEYLGGDDFLEGGGEGCSSSHLPSSQVQRVVVGGDVEVGVGLGLGLSPSS